MKVLLVAITVILILSLSIAFLPNVSSQATSGSLEILNDASKYLIFDFSQNKDVGPNLASPDGDVKIMQSRYFGVLGSILSLDMDYQPGKISSTVKKKFVDTTLDDCKSFDVKGAELKVDETVCLTTREGYIVKIGAVSTTSDKIQVMWEKAPFPTPITSPIVSSQQSTGYTINTMAGGTDASFDGDGQDASMGKFRTPSGIAFDFNGNLYIADTGNQVIRKIDAQTGKLSTIAGIPMRSGFSGDGGPAIGARLANPSGVVVDDKGNVYIADQSNNRIRMVSGQDFDTNGDGNPEYKKGYIYTVAGTGETGLADDTFGILNYPQGIAIVTPIKPDATIADLYITEPGANGIGHRVRRYTASRPSRAGGSLIQTVAGTGEAGFSDSPVKFNGPTDVVVDSKGNVYIVDFGNNRIRYTNGQTFAGGGSKYEDNISPLDAVLYGPTGLAIDSPDNIYVSTKNYQIKKIGITGADGKSAPLKPPQTIQLYKDDAKTALFGTVKFGIATAFGDVFGSDYSGANDRRHLLINGISAKNKNGEEIWIGVGETATTNKYKIKLELWDQSLLKFNIEQLIPDSIITTIAGTGAQCTSGTCGDGGYASSATLVSVPRDIAINPLNNKIYFTEGNKIRVLTPPSVISSPLDIYHQQSSVISSLRTNLGFLDALGTVIDSSYSTQTNSVREDIAGLIGNLSSFSGNELDKIKLGKLAVNTYKRETDKTIKEQLIPGMGELRTDDTFLLLASETRKMAGNTPLSLTFSLLKHGGTASTIISDIGKQDICLAEDSENLVLNWQQPIVKDNEIEFKFTQIEVVIGGIIYGSVPDIYFYNKKTGRWEATKSNSRGELVGDRFYDENLGDDRIFAYGQITDVVERSEDYDIGRGYLIRFKFDNNNIFVGYGGKVYQDPKGQESNPIPFVGPVICPQKQSMDGFTLLTPDTAELNSVYDIIIKVSEDVLNPPSLIPVEISSGSQKITVNLEPSNADPLVYTLSKEPADIIEIVSQSGYSNKNTLFKLKADPNDIITASYGRLAATTIIGEPQIKEDDSFIDPRLESVVSVFETNNADVLSSLGDQNIVVYVHDNPFVPQQQTVTFSDGELTPYQNGAGLTKTVNLPANTFVSTVDYTTCFRFTKKCGAFGKSSCSGKGLLDVLVYDSDGKELKNTANWVSDRSKCQPSETFIVNRFANKVDLTAKKKDDRPEYSLAQASATINTYPFKSLTKGVDAISFVIKGGKITSAFFGGVSNPTATLVTTKNFLKYIKTVQPADVPGKITASLISGDMFLKDASGQNVFQTVLENKGDKLASFITDIVGGEKWDIKPGEERQIENFQDGPGTLKAVVDSSGQTIRFVALKSDPKKGVIISPPLGIPTGSCILLDDSSKPQDFQGSFSIVACDSFSTQSVSCDINSDPFGCGSDAGDSSGTEYFEVVNFDRRATKLFVPSGGDVFDTIITRMVFSDAQFTASTTKDFSTYEPVTVSVGAGILINKPAEEVTITRIDNSRGSVKIYYRQTYKRIVIPVITSQSPALGSLTVNSMPAGANVYVDTIGRGLTPYNVSDLIVGNHTITLTKFGYDAYKTIVNIVTGDNSLSVNLVQAVSPSPTPIYSLNSTPTSSPSPTPIPDTVYKETISLARGETKIFTPANVTGNTVLKMIELSNLKFTIDVYNSAGTVSHYSNLPDTAVGFNTAIDKIVFTLNSDSPTASATVTVSYTKQPISQIQLDNLYSIMLSYWSYDKQYRCANDKLKNIGYWVEYEIVPGGPAYKMPVLYPPIGYPKPSIPIQSFSKPTQIISTGCENPTGNTLPFGIVDFISPIGWVYDADSPTSPIDVKIVGRTTDVETSNYKSFVKVVSANQPRPDLATGSFLPEGNTNHGFILLLDDIGEGEYVINVYAIDPQTGEEREIRNSGRIMTLSDKPTDLYIKNVNYNSENFKVDVCMSGSMSLFEIGDTDYISKNPNHGLPVGYYTDVYDYNLNRVSSVEVSQSADTSQEIKNIKAGQCTSFTPYLTESDRSKWQSTGTIAIQIDPENKIDEANEDNNKWMCENKPNIGIMCNQYQKDHPETDLELKSVTRQLQQSSGAYMFSVGVCVSGPKAPYNMQIDHPELSGQLPYGYKAGISQSGGLQAGVNNLKNGQCGNFNFVGPTQTDYTRASETIIIELDSNDVIKEKSETNNKFICEKDICTRYPKPSIPPSTTDFTVKNMVTLFNGMMAEIDVCVQGDKSLNDWRQITGNPKLDKFPLKVEVVDDSGNIAFTDAIGTNIGIKGGSDGAGIQKNGNCFIAQVETLGKKRLDVIPDPDNLIPEVDEKNNKFTCMNGVCQQACSDSDGGEDIYTKGTTIEHGLYDTTRADSCIDSSTVNEYYCYNGGIYSKTGGIKCPLGSSCSDGACVTSSGGTIAPAITSGKIIADWPLQSSSEVDLEVRSAVSSPTDKYTMTLTVCNNGQKSLSELGLLGITRVEGVNTISNGIMTAADLMGFSVTGLPDIKNGQCAQRIVTLKGSAPTIFDNNNLNFAIDPYNIVLEQNENNNRLLCRNGACLPPKSTSSLDLGIVEARRADYQTAPGSYPEGKYKFVVKYTSTGSTLELQGVKHYYGFEIIDTNGDVYRILSGVFPTLFGKFSGTNEILEIPLAYREIYDRSEKVNIILDPLNIVVESNENNNRISCTGTTCS